MSGGALDVDLPILRHLTYREAHLFELGLWPGAAVALALFAGEYGLALATVAVIRRRMQRTDRDPDRPALVQTTSTDQTRSPASGDAPSNDQSASATSGAETSTRPSLVRAYVRDAWYFGVGAVFGFFALFVAALVAGAPIPDVAAPFV